MRARLLALSMLAVAIAPGTEGFAAPALAPDNLSGLRPRPALPLEKRSSGEDQPDAEPGLNQTHALYFVPSDSVDNQLEDAIRGAIGSIRAWFRRETAWRADKTAIQPRFDRLLGGGWDVTFVAGDKASAEYMGIRDIADELVVKGFNASNKRYLVYAETSVAGNAGRCGESNYPYPEVAGAPIAVVYLLASEGCGARDLGGKPATTAAHEWLHLDAAVPVSAPHYCPLGHVCTGPLWQVPAEFDPMVTGPLCDAGVRCDPRIDPEAVDIMFPLTWRGIDGMVLDRNHDDYFDRFAENALGEATTAVPPEAPWYDLRRSPWME